MIWTPPPPSPPPTWGVPSTLSDSVKVSLIATAEMTAFSKTSPMSDENSVTSRPLDSATTLVAWDRWSAKHLSPHEEEKAVDIACLIALSLISALDVDSVHSVVSQLMGTTIWNLMSPLTRSLRDRRPVRLTPFMLRISTLPVISPVMILIEVFRTSTTFLRPSSSLGISRPTIFMVPSKVMVLYSSEVHNRLVSIIFATQGTHMVLVPSFRHTLSHSCPNRAEKARW
mmetsp:Transcript_6898/g.13778  ORF Transcript_6898/g.13778 Transcript_6898/m.13778 type:complete len:228 (-) Transcript_6898:6085-6768(-)